MRAGGALADFLSRGWSASLLPGANVAPGLVRGYYIDFRVKAKTTVWPPQWLHPGDGYIKVAQWALGSYERYLAGQGEARLAWAVAAGRYLLEQQRRGGAHDGGWEHLAPYPHTFRVRPPWLSAMAQGEGASLLVRLFLETGDEAFAEGARRALRPMALPTSEGGVRAVLDGGWFPEEYPTTPPALVLNGGIFALWGYYDVWTGLADKEAGRLFEEGAHTLARNLDRWDTGYWSRYDLYPHPVPNVASPAYHLLHINQLRAMNAIAPRAEFAAAAARFEAYARSPAKRTHALFGKALFRIVVPRNRWVGGLVRRLRA